MEDDTDCVFQAEHAGQVCGRNLADAVPEQHLGPHAPRRPQLGKPDLKREDRGLRDRGVVHARA